MKLCYHGNGVVIDFLIHYVKIVFIIRSVCWRMILCILLIVFFYIKWFIFQIF